MIRSPFACGQAWFARTYKGHEPNAVDWNLGGSGESDYGQPVFAGASGIASVKQDAGGYGTYVLVDHGAGWQSLYAHLSAVTINSGQPVDADTQVGRVGRSGHADGSHLHHEQRLNGIRQQVILDGGVVQPSQSSRGASYTSRNCPSATATVQLFVDAARTQSVASDDAPPASSLYARVTAPVGVNPGLVPITANAPSALAATDWASPSQPKYRQVDRDGRWTAEFDLTTPNQEGGIAERFQIGDKIGFDLALTMKHRLRWDDSLVRLSLDRAGRVATRGDKLAPGQVVWVHITARNAGTITWAPGSVTLQTAPNAHRSVLAHWDWETETTPGYASTSVGSGSTGTFVFPIVAPDHSGTYTERFAPASAGRHCECLPAAVQIRVIQPTSTRLAPAKTVTAATDTSSRLA